MPTGHEYRERAEECRLLARRTFEKLERDALLRMAEQWDRLAQFKDDLYK